ncbi:MAG: type I glyceraldehyde-3-phosphate dehydrogenase [Candidatus Moraniibacteriota bacterium]
MQKTRVAINGFGRIGRNAMKIALGKPELEVVAINDLTDAPTLAHLLRYDSAYGHFRGEVKAENGALVIDGTRYPVYAEPEPEKLPWGKHAVDVVLECTGRFTTREGAIKHVTAGAKKVILSAPAKDEDESIPTYLLGVNAEHYGDENVISNASCTTNSLAPVAQVLHETFGIEKGLMTTVHSYTADQNLQDGPHKDLRRARAAAQNIVPTTTGAAISVTQVIPELNGKFDGMSLRVPTIVVSLTDFTFLLKQDVTPETVNEALKKAAGAVQYRGVLAVSEEPLVSSDYIGNPFSSVIDLSLTKVVGGNLVKVVAWYDNEWGYSNRLVEMALHIAA